MTEYTDFRQVLVDLVGKRVRLCLVLAETDRVYEYIGWIKGVEDHTLVFENDPTVGGYPITTTRFNLESIVVYGVDEVPDDADLTDKPEATHVGEVTEYIPYDKDGKPVREPQKGYVILHKDHIYKAGTVYTKLPERGEVAETGD